MPQNTSKLDVGKMIKSIVSNRALLGIIAAAIMLLLGMLGMSGMAPYVFPVYYNSASAQSMSSLASNLCVLFICAPFAAKIAAKIGKKEMSVVLSVRCRSMAGMPGGSSPECYGICSLLFSFLHWSGYVQYSYLGYDHRCY